MREIALKLSRSFSLEMIDHLGFVRSRERGERFFLNQHSMETDEIMLIDPVQWVSRGMDLVWSF